MITDAGEGEITVVTSESQGLLICCGQWFKLMNLKRSFLLFSALHYVPFSFPFNFRRPVVPISVLSGSWKDSEDTEKENQQTTQAIAVSR